MHKHLRRVWQHSPSCPCAKHGSLLPLYIRRPSANAPRACLEREACKTEANEVISAAMFYHHINGVQTVVYGPGVRSHTGSEQQAWEVGWYDIFDSFPHERVDKKLEKKLHVQEVFHLT